MTIQLFSTAFVEACILEEKQLLNLIITLNTNSNSIFNLNLILDLDLLVDSYLRLTILNKIFLSTSQYYNFVFSKKSEI